MLPSSIMSLHFLKNICTAVLLDRQSTVKDHGTKGNTFRGRVYARIVETPAFCCTYLRTRASPAALGLSDSECRTSHKVNPFATKQPWGKVCQQVFHRIPTPRICGLKHDSSSITTQAHTHQTGVCDQQSNTSSLAPCACCRSRPTCTLPWAVTQKNTPSRPVSAGKAPQAKEGGRRCRGQLQQSHDRKKAAEGTLLGARLPADLEGGHRPRRGAVHREGKEGLRSTQDRREGGQGELRAAGSSSSDAAAALVARDSAARSVTPSFARLVQQRGTPMSCSKLVHDLPALAAFSFAPAPKQVHTHISWSEVFVGLHFHRRWKHGRSVLTWMDGFRATLARSSAYSSNLRHVLFA